MAINHVVISGNLTRDPELRLTQSGSAILTFCLAINEWRKNAQSGEREQYTHYIDCTMFGPRAEGLSNILAKGMKVAVEGKLRYNSWERDGQRRSKVDVVMTNCEIMTMTKAKSTSESELNSGSEDYIELAPEDIGF